MEKLKLEKKDVPKTLEDFVVNLIYKTDQAFTSAKKAHMLKSNPLVALWRDDQLTPDFLAKEMELISKKQSSLPAGKRAAVVAFMKEAMAEFDKMNNENAKKAS